MSITNNKTNNACMSNSKALSDNDGDELKRYNIAHSKCVLIRVREEHMQREASELMMWVTPMVSLTLGSVAKGEAGIVLFEIKTLTNVCQITDY
jgi:hypothetical protein